MLDIWNLRRDLNTDLIGKADIIHFSEVSSTNDFAVKCGKTEGINEGTLIIAEHQTAGRGRYGRTWKAPKGKCILASVILRCRLKQDQVHLPNLIGALSIAQGIKDFTGLEALIKHPNDVRISGKKVAGVLSELHYDVNRRPFVVLGFGVNVNITRSQFPEELRENSTSVLVATSESKDNVVLCQGIDALYLGQGNPAPTNRSTHHLSVDRAVICRERLLQHILQKLEANYLLLRTGEIELILEQIKLWEEKG